MIKILTTIGLVITLSSSVVAQQVLAIKNVNLVDGRAGTTKQNMTILLENNRIVSVGKSNVIQIPRNAKIVDGTGQWAIPGLIDVHSHSKSRQVLQRALALGVTTIHCMPSLPDTTLDLELWSSTASSPSPRVLLTQWLFTGEFPGNISPNTWAIVKPATPDEARQNVDRVRRDGFKHIKVFFDTGKLWFHDRPATPTLSPEVVRAVIDRAHELRLRVYAHALEAALAPQAVEAGVDALIHPVADSIMPESFWNEMRKRGTIWTTTLAVFEGLGNPAGFARRVLADSRLRQLLSATGLQNFARDTGATAFTVDTLFPAVRSRRIAYSRNIVENTKKALSNGITVAIGSDQSAGIGTHIELELWQEAGLTPAQIIVAATYGSSKALGLDRDIGTIEANKRADIVLLSANPLTDIRNTRAVEMTIKGGQLYIQRELMQTGSK